ncbi:hypothetical protein [Mesorhizobium sp. B1-1-7]|uniref:hypothetical protein n=1 Tax=Mesorhizobium sp. B1-1-7 TaxID=2589977 RepID=UPI0011277571|nr:hypothetical protein [Mesorhizobium sp. B1-1-7]TPN53981.1 hypothetical protein FJ978_07715 [Mesorhizobium sp. B1-1-7]
MTENPHPTQSIDFDAAIEVWLLRRQGWYQHQIAAEFHVNPARINEVLKERKHVGSKQEADRRSH